MQVRPYQLSSMWADSDTAGLTAAGLSPPSRGAAHNRKTGGACPIGASGRREGVEPTFVGSKEDTTRTLIQEREGRGLRKEHPLGGPSGAPTGPSGRPTVRGGRGRIRPWNTPAPRVPRLLAVTAAIDPDRRLWLLDQQRQPDRHRRSHRHAVADAGRLGRADDGRRVADRRSGDRLRPDRVPGPGDPRAHREEAGRPQAPRRSAAQDEHHRQLREGQPAGRDRGQ